MTPTCRRVLNALESAQFGLASTYLAQSHIGGLDYRKRISELRIKHGYKITTHPIPNKPFRRYVLEGRPQ